ncbi:PQQ-dependent sugar dehydrogenase [Luteolibacter luteus]|uniref:PQQ-dependent sugar dehydrogenase n=1 Tax=Luteolibacter luteus TaxID=2728835 RepID=A0A858RIY9_9BACT|nr:PQQ-dependent sugar dehydrogenase [Luteolibacter luteus]QJE97206.1 PQQ-dependent sugar dehydrogenase [Luteolibacter luteus]
MKMRILTAFLLSAGPLLAAFPALQLKPVAVGQFFSPTTVAHAGDGSGRLFITDQRGKIHVLQDGVVLPVPFLDLSARLVPELSFDERGLLGLAFHPDYEVEGAAGKGKFYVFYSAPAIDTVPAPINCRSVIAEYRVSAANPNVADPTSERVLLTFNKPQFNHNGGQLAFGPSDKMLYIATGDGGGSNDNQAGHTGNGTAAVLGNSQDLTKLLGKVLRIDPLGTNGPGGQYGIPSDNPFVLSDVPSLDERKEIYAYGLRNPWRFSFDRGGDHRLFLADVGQANFEEINLIVPGGNYGWRRFEGFADVFPTTPSTGPHIEPIAAYAHPSTADPGGLLKIGLSVTGGYVYRGSEIPALQGKYVFGDWSTSFSVPGGTLLGLEETAPGSFALSKLDVTGGNPIGRFIPTFGEDEAGELYVATRTMDGPSEPEPGGLPSGQLYKIVATATEQTANLVADRDNAIFSDFPGNSSGAGDLYAGQIANSPAYRRALIHFNLSSIPAGADVTSAEVTLQVTKVGPSTGGDFTFGLHRLTADWGEGTSVSLGQGAPADEGEATWEDAKFNQLSWDTPGGDFVAGDSASRVVSNLGTYTWSAAGLAADVQSWVDQPASNFGWILRGDETTASAKVFGARHTAAPPRLTVKYLPGSAQTHREIWESQYYLPGQYIDPDGDADSDQIKELLEYAWDLNPQTVQKLEDYFGVEIASLPPRWFSAAIRARPISSIIWKRPPTSRSGLLWSAPSRVILRLVPLSFPRRRIPPTLPRDGSRPVSLSTIRAIQSSSSA